MSRFYNPDIELSSSHNDYRYVYSEACPERSRRDHRNLPIHFYLDNDDELIANYNAEGQRIIKESSGGGWSFYVMDGMQILAVVTEQGLSHMNLAGSGTFGRIPVNLSGNITTTNTRYYHITDHLGSTRAVVNASGSVVQTYDYYPFGLEMPGRSLTSGPTARERFTGHERDEEVGLDYTCPPTGVMQARRYAAEFGRFLGVDPILHQLSPNELVGFGEAKHFRYSPYVYVLNNPLIFVDPDGFTDRKALLKGVGRTALGAGGVVAGVGLIVAGAGLAPFTGGTSGVKAFAGASVMAIGTSEVAFGIADIVIASKTPDGMTAEEFNSFLGIIADAVGGSKTSQEVMNLATDIITGGGLLKIGKNIADDKVIRALIQSGVLSTDTMNILQAIEDDNRRNEEIENDKDPIDGEDEKN